MLEEYHEEGSFPGVFEFQLLFSVKNVASHFSFPILEPYIRELVCLGIHSGYGEQREAAGNYFFRHNK